MGGKNEISGNAVRILRKRFRLSLLELAHASDLSESYLSLFESGKRELSPDAKGRILKALIRKMDDFIEQRKRDIRKLEEENRELADISKQLSMISKSEHIAIGAGR
jgi:transcriptional regulator with XRE-family HTH domain